MLSKFSLLCKSRYRCTEILPLRISRTCVGTLRSECIITATHGSLANVLGACMVSSAQSRNWKDNPRVCKGASRKSFTAKRQQKKSLDMAEKSGNYGQTLLYSNLFNQRKYAHTNLSLLQLWTLTFKFTRF